MKSKLFCTAFYITDQKAVNVKGKKLIEIYFNCICVFFASLHRFYPTNKKILFINDHLPARYCELLNNYNVEIVIISSNDLRFVNSINLSNNFPGCLFSLDILCCISRNEEKYKEYNSILLLDNDILFANPIDEEIFDEEIFGYPILYDFQKVVNGKSRATLSYANAIIGNLNAITWYGGELIGLDKKYCSIFSSHAEKLFTFFEENSGLFGNQITEEHIYSIILSNYKPNNHLAQKLIKRVWTTYGYNNITGDEKEYKILHYPAEKNKLFIELFNHISTDPLYLSNLNETEYLDIIYSPINSHMFPNKLMKIKQRFGQLKGKLISKL